MVPSGGIQKYEKKMTLCSFTAYIEDAVTPSDPKSQQTASIHTKMKRLGEAAKALHQHCLYARDWRFT